MVEIDGTVVEACKKYLPNIGTAWNDPRLHVHIDDGVAWVKKEHATPYDVILVDGADPVGPAEGLFNQAFFEGCKNALSAQGVLSTQAESPDMMRDVHLAMIETLEKVFPKVHPRSEEHTSELQSRGHLVCRLLLEKKKKTHQTS